MSDNLKPREVAAMFGVSRDTVLRWSRLNQIPHFRIPGPRGDFRYRRDEIEALLASKPAGEENDE